MADTTIQPDFIETIVRRVAREFSYDLRNALSDQQLSLDGGALSIDTEDIVAELKTLNDDEGNLTLLRKAAELLAKTLTHDSDTGDEVSIVAKIDMMIAMLGGNETGVEQPAIVRAALALDRAAGALERLATVAEKIAPALAGLSFEVAEEAPPADLTKQIGSDRSWAQKQLDEQNETAALQAIEETPAADLAVDPPKPPARTPAKANKVGRHPARRSR